MSYLVGKGLPTLQSVYNNQLSPESQLGILPSYDVSSEKKNRLTADFLKVLRACKFTKSHLPVVNAPLHPSYNFEEFSPRSGDPSSAPLWSPLLAGVTL